MTQPTFEMYEPIAGGFRARLAEVLDVDPVTGSSGLIGVSLNTSGRALKGTIGQTGLVGVTVKNVARGPIANGGNLGSGIPNPYSVIGVQPGDPIDIMTNGMISGLDKDDFPAGTGVFINPAGEAYSSPAGNTGDFQVGHTVDAGVVVIRFVPGTPAVA